VSTETDRTETDRLRARVAELERQLAEQAARANAAIAAAQERAYWLDRWQIDLNQLMATRGGAAFRAGMRAMRVPIRRLRMLKRRLLG
jgi:MarR-like DNA-binding transcriptional regulator SgrR of sgrS sRNA